MDRSKFERLIREFPFLTKIVTEENLSADSISYVEVKRGDRNLLEATPEGWVYDAGGLGEHSGYRHFWFVAPGELGSLKSSWRRSQVPLGTMSAKSADPIGVQLLDLDRDVQFIVEVHEEHWDWEERTPEVVIYKMNDLAWRRFVHPVQTQG